ncbi:uracil-DNA glycosylase family protein [Vibrio sp. FJH11]
MKNQFEAYKPYLLNYSKNYPFAPELKMMSDGPIEVYYSPFDAVNPRAKICIVGISPGKTQADNANACACEWLNRGASTSTILENAKNTASFSGTLRNNLVALLDYIGLSKHWGLTSASQLFTTDQHLLHSTSVFRYPVLVNGEPISSAQQGLKHPILKSMVDTYLASECQTLSSDVLYIPLGKGTAEILSYLAEQGYIGHKQILTGIPHPSGANAERIAYYMGRKDKQNLSSQTNSNTLDEMKAALFQQLTDLGVKVPRAEYTGNLTTRPSQVDPSKQINLIPTEGIKTMNTSTCAKQMSDLRSPNDRFMRDDVEKQLRALLSELGLTTNPIKSRQSKELAVTSGGTVVAYISRLTGLKDAKLTICLHPKYKNQMDSRVQQLENVTIKVGRDSRYISSSNYRDFKSKGFSTEIKTNEHIAIAYIIDVSAGYHPLASFFRQYLEVK